MLGEARAYGLDFKFPIGDTAVGASLREYGEFARVILDYLLAEAAAAPAPGALIDVGANVGSICLPFAARFPDWRVIAVEAHEGLAKILAGNVERNGLGNIEALHAMAGPASGTIDFPAVPLEGSRNFGDIGIHTPAPSASPTRTVTLDEIAPSDTRLVKVDVEGFETRVLDGARELVSARRAVWLVEASIQHPKGTENTIRRFLEAEYQVFWFYAPFVTPEAEGGEPPNPGLGDSNIVALPPDVPNRWRLAAARPEKKRPQAVGSYPYLARYGYAAWAERQKAARSTAEPSGGG